LKRILLDEGVPVDLVEPLAKFGVDATAFPNEWKQLSNGALLTAAEQYGYQVLITNDKRMPYQQSLKRRNISVLVLPTNRRDDVLAVVSQIVAALAIIEPRQFLSLVDARPGSSPTRQR
jgi:hypothetical protein